MANCFQLTKETCRQFRPLRSETHWTMIELTGYSHSLIIYLWNLALCFCLLIQLRHHCWSIGRGSVLGSVPLLLIPLSVTSCSDRTRTRYFDSLPHLLLFVYCSPGLVFLELVLFRLSFCYVSLIASFHLCLRWTKKKTTDMLDNDVMYITHKSISKRTRLQSNYPMKITK